MLHVMRRLWPVVALLVLACGSSQPVEPLTGSYAVVFDSSFMGAVRSGPSAAFPASEIESSIRELFTERGGAFQWYHEPP